MNLKQKLKTHNMLFYSALIYILLLIFIPKSVTNFKGIPVRIGLSFLFILIFFIMLYKKKISINKNNYKLITFIYLLFIIFAIPSLSATRNFIVSIYTFLKFIVAYCLFFIAYKYNFKKQEYLIFLKVIIISLLILGGIGILEYLFDKDIFKAGISYYEGATGRISTTFFNTIYYGIFINLFFVLIFYAFCKSKNKLITILLFIASTITYVNILLTFTRSALLVFFAILILAIIFLYKMSINFKTLLLILTMILLTVYIPGASKLAIKSCDDAIAIFSKFENILSFLPDINSNKNKDNQNPKDYKDYDDDSDYKDYSLQHREEFAHIAKVIANENKYTGVGFGSYIDYMKSSEFKKLHPEYNLPYTHPHSSFVLLYAEVSTFSLMFFILFLIMLVFKPARLFLSNFSKKNEVYNLSVICSLITMGFIAVNAIAENAIYDTQIFPLFLLLYGMLINYIYISDTNNKVMFISSTGGHLNELLQLKQLFNKYDSYIVTEKTKSNKTLKDKYSNVYYLVYGTKLHLFTYIFKFSYNIIKSLILYLKINPKVIVTTGTHTAVPMCYIGKVFGSKIIYIETFANRNTKSVAGKIISPIADTFIVQWEEMMKLYPKAIYGGWIF